MNKNISFIPDILKSSILSDPDNRNTFVLKEKNAKYIANNKNHKTAISIQIDGSLIKSTDSKKCDKGLCIEDKRIFLIELKGVDFNTACEQLLVTYTTISPLIPDFKYKCRAVVREKCQQKIITHILTGFYLASFQKKKTALKALQVFWKKTYSNHISCRIENRIPLESGKHRYSTIFHSERVLSFVEKLAPIFTMRFPLDSYGLA